MTAKSYPGGTVSADTAHALVAAIAAHAAENGRAAAISVCDAGGVLKAFLRMDGAPLLAIKWAHDKAYTAAGFGLATDVWYPMIKDNGPLMTGIPQGERVVVFGGGFPLVIDGVLVGGVGVSGGMPDQDIESAQAGMAKVGFAAT